MLLKTVHMFHEARSKQNEEEITEAVEEGIQEMAGLCFPAVGSPGASRGLGALFTPNFRGGLQLTWVSYVDQPIFPNEIGSAR